MNALLTSLYNDEAGFIVSAELVLISTIAVLSLVVGLSELAININNELEDVGSAFSSVQQSYEYGGTWGCRAGFSGSSFQDHPDLCSDECDIR
ncbi:MAG: branched-chain amino acid aminotransferase [Maioricimonas sp. JB049]